MRIAIIVDAFPVLSETFVTNQVCWFLSKGFKVELFARFRLEQDVLHPDIAKHHLMGITHFWDYCPEEKERFSPPAWAALKNIFRSPVEILKLLHKYRQHIISLKQLNFLIPLLSKKFDIIHCHFGPNGMLGIYAKEMGVRAPVITSFNGYDCSLTIVTGGRDFYRDLFRQGDLFMPVSDYFRRRLVELGCDEKKIVVHHSGIDLGKFMFLERKIRDGEMVKILTVGRLVEKKGHEYMIKALARLVARRQNILYVIAGVGPLRAGLESLSRKLGIEKHVRFMGAVNQDELLLLYRSAHVFALPSITADNGDQEGISATLMEAQASGLPVLATWHSGIPELVVDGKSGFLVPERDVGALEDKLNYLIEHPELWPSMGRFGRCIVEEGYNLDTLNWRLVEIYQNLLRGNNRYATPQRETHS